MNTFNNQATTSSPVSLKPTPTVINVSYSMIVIELNHITKTSGHILTCEIDELICYPTYFTNEQIWKKMLKEKKTNTASLTKLEHTGIKVLHEKVKHFVQIDHKDICCQLKPALRRTARASSSFIKMRPLNLHKFSM